MELFFFCGSNLKISRSLFEKKFLGKQNNRKCCFEWHKTVKNGLILRNKKTNNSLLKLENDLKELEKDFKYREIKIRRKTEVIF